MNLGSTGKKGEDMVARFLRNQGCVIEKRNFSCRFGEVDIIASKGDLLLFVEVKTRKENSLISGAEAVDPRKINRILLTAQDYMMKRINEGKPQPRFDVAVVTFTEDNPPKFKLKYIKNAF